MSGGTAGGGVSPVPREARPYQGRRAGLVTRLVAACIDAAVVGLVLLAGYFGLAALIFLVDPRGFSMPHAGLVFSLTAAFVASIVYLTASWTLSGRTYGDLVMGLRVLGRGERPLGFTTSAARAVFVTLVPIGVPWVEMCREIQSLDEGVVCTPVAVAGQPRGAQGHPQE